MIDRSEEIRELLRGTHLERAQILEMEILDTSEIALVIEITLANALESWKVMRDFLTETQRWPVIVACWGTTGRGWAKDVLDQDWFSRFYFHEEGYPDVSPAAVLSRVDSVNFSEFLDRQSQKLPEDLDPKPSYLSEAEALALSDLDWYEPLGQTLALFLLPTLHGWDSLSYLSWFGSTTVGSATAIAALKLWHQRYGAELVCHYGTMLQLQVDRKPSTLDEALELARQQISLAPCTTQLEGVTLRDHAHALLKSNRWFIHERP